MSPPPATSPWIRIRPTDKMDSETYILKSGHYQIEVMANLDQLPAKGALIVVTWPRSRTGFAARAFAIVP